MLVRASDISRTGWTVQSTQTRIREEMKSDFTPPRGISGRHATRTWRLSEEVDANERAVTKSDDDNKLEVSSNITRHRAHHRRITTSTSPTKSKHDQHTNNNININLNQPRSTHQATYTFYQPLKRTSSSKNDQVIKTPIVRKSHCRSIITIHSKLLQSPPKHLHCTTVLNVKRT